MHCSFATEIRANCDVCCTAPDWHDYCGFCRRLVTGSVRKMYLCALQHREISVVMNMVTSHIASAQKAIAARKL